MGQGRGTPPFILSLLEHFFLSSNIARDHTDALPVGDSSKICKLFNWDKMMRKVSVIIKSSRIANKRLCTLLYSQLSRYEADMKEKRILMKQLMDATGSKQLLSRIRVGSEPNYEGAITSAVSCIQGKSRPGSRHPVQRSCCRLCRRRPTVRKKVKIPDCARKILGCQSNQSW